MNIQIEDYLKRKFFRELLTLPKRKFENNGNLKDRIAIYNKYLFDNLIVTYGNDREYLAMKLTGKFFSYNKIDSKITPHIEILESELDKNGVDFLYKLASIGNGVNFNLLMVNEVTAIKRALFNFSNNSGNIEFLNKLEVYRENLINSYKTTADLTLKQWVAVEMYINNNSSIVSKEITGKYSKMISEIFPEFKELNLEVEFERKLLEKEGDQVIKRLGVFRVYNKNNINLAAITPRLTNNSLFIDKNFKIEDESTLAILVRLLLLNKLLYLVFNKEEPITIIKDAKYFQRNGHFRALAAIEGKPLPESSVKACSNLITAYQDGNSAYNAIIKWSDGRYKLTVNKNEYLDSFSKALLEKKRLGEIKQSDINVLLPILWGREKDIYRLTYVYKEVK